MESISKDQPTNDNGPHDMTGMDGQTVAGKLVRGPLASGPDLAGAVGEIDAERGNVWKRCSKCGIVKKIDEFTSQVDYVLSESNATTFFNVELVD